MTAAALLRALAESPRRALGGPGPRTALLALPILAGKALWLALAGVTYEADTATYLNYLVPYHHPPGYSAFLLGLEALLPSVWLIAAVQIALFAAAAAIFVRRFAMTRAGAWILAGVMAADPITSFFCANLMSEGLFVPLTLIWLVLLDLCLAEDDAARGLAALLWLAPVTALAYTVRLPAAILVPFVPLALLLARRSLSRAIVWGAVLFFAVQALIVPVKLVYLERYDSFSMSLFQGSPLWNSASVLYPDSAVRRTPRTEFERFLAERDPAEFTIHAALMTDAIHGDGSAYQDFLTRRRMTVDEHRDFERSLARTSLRIILGDPLGYLRRFVLPNQLQPLRADETIPLLPDVQQLMHRRFGYAMTDPVRYHARSWRIEVGLLLLGTALTLVRRGGTRRRALLLLGLAWYTALLLPVLATVFLRYLLVVAPAIHGGLFAAIERIAAARARGRAAG